MNLGGRGQPGGGRVFYGWYVTGVAFMANLLSTGTTFYVFNAFLLPLCEQRGWTRAQINAAPMMGYVLGLAAQFVYGSLFLRVGPRALMTMGALVSSLAFILLGRVQDLAWFYLLYILLYLGNGAMNGIVANTVVSNWFVKKRGQALGLATAGMSVSGVALPLLAMYLVERLSLEAAFLVIGLMVAAQAPLAWLVISISPEARGLKPDGLQTLPGQEPAPENAPLAAEAGSLASLARSGAFWRLGLAFSLAMMGAAGVSYQLAPRFQDLGHDNATAMLLTALVAALATLGKFLWGLFCDWGHPRRMVIVLMLGKALGLGLGLIPASQAGLMLFIFVFGFAMGGVMATFPIMAAHLFGRQAFARVYRLLVLFLALQGAGYLIMGQSFSLTGSYDAAFVCFIVLDLAAAWLIRGLPRGRVDRAGGQGGDLASSCQGAGGHPIC